ncbi:hypothetical protein HD554DRAFT_2170515 [Boletus coccyginus]|nr:hypothetical protein HD554DRAFT_2170515 [Boletus coccyginus]
MAKPNHAYPTPVSLHTPARLRPPRFPSPAILSALAVIATHPVVAGSPVPPPSFLCPFIERDIPVTSIPPPPPPAQCGALADRYVQGSDGLWKKSEAWTLYGSTCYPTSTLSTSAVQSEPGSSQSSNPTFSASMVEFDTSVLPAGWDGGGGHSSNIGSTTILALAIALAGSICVFIIGCVIWRRRKKRARDIERKLGHKPSAHDNSQDNGLEKDIRGKMRIWAKATARWKANVRQSARRRRKRPTVSSAASRPLHPTFSDSPQPSVAASPAPSRRASIASGGPRSSSPVALNSTVTDPPAVLHDPRPRSLSPPTYGATFLPRCSHPSLNSAAPNPSSTPPPASPRLSQTSNRPSFVEDDPLPYIPPSDGHVATDDKSRLEHIRGLASSPPTVVDAAGASTVQSVSAPELNEVEDDLEGLDIDSSEVPVSCHDFGFPPSFPPPPSKADVPLPFGYLDDHPLRYGERDSILASLPAPGSLGPLGASPAVPPLGLQPSAPSLGTEDELFEDWDDASSYIPEVPTSADPACAIESFISSASRTSFPSTRESARRDSILPRYQP